MYTVVGGATRAGAGPGLQSRWEAWDQVFGGFDSRALPPASLPAEEAMSLNIHFHDLPHSDQIRRSCEPWVDTLQVEFPETSCNHIANTAKETAHALINLQSEPVMVLRAY